MSHDVQILTTTDARSSAAAVVPAARCPIAIRVATMADLPFLDSLQKKHNKALGYFPTKQFEGYIGMGGVLVAESDGKTIGYVISRDRYLKRDELGVIYQLCVAPGAQRSLVGATLVKEVFARSAYGCRLYCCWCAQDLEANRFWESLGFAAIAFRAGSTGKRRVHIFWQRRVDDGDAETKWWYPSQTSGGAIREDRLVFPIPPGTHWSEVKAVVLPNADGRLPNGKPKALGGGGRKSASGNRKPAMTMGPPPGKVGIVVGGRIKYVDRPGYVPTAAERAIELRAKGQRGARAPREGRAKVKLDSKLVAAARELRDRYLEHINSGPLLPVGKYDVSRGPQSRCLGIVDPRALDGPRATVAARPAGAARRLSHHRAA